MKYTALQEMQEENLSSVKASEVNASDRAQIPQAVEPRTMENLGVSFDTILGEKKLIIPKKKYTSAKLQKPRLANPAYFSAFEAILADELKDRNSTKNENVRYMTTLILGYFSDAID